MPLARLSRRAYDRTGRLREGGKKCRSAGKGGEGGGPCVGLCKGEWGRDRPKSAMDVLEEEASKCTSDHRRLLGSERIYDQLNKQELSVAS